LSVGVRSNIRFYVAMVLGRWLVGSARITPESLEKLDLAAVNDQLLNKAYRLVREEFLSAGGDDRTAKGPEFVEGIKAVLKKTGPRGGG